MRSGDPLNPSYKLPEVEMKPVTPPKFIRDHINNDDIEGSKPKKPVYYQTRDNILKVEDIPGAKARDRTFTRTTQFDAINYRDVTHADFKSKRVTNPLEPTYVVRNEDGSTTTIGKIENSTSHKIPERKRGPLSSSLETSDIAGAQTGTKNLGVFATFKRKDYSKTNDISDIAGSTVGSLRKGPATKRISNPLNPDYQMPGGSEFKETNAFGNTGQQVVAGPQPISSQTRFAHRVKPPIAMPHNINREHFKRDRNQFYGEEDKNFADVDFNKLYKATKNPNPDAAPQMAPDLRDDVGFRRNEKKFYSQDQTDKSEFEYNQAKFYSGGAQNPAELDRARLENLGGHAKVQKPEVNTKAQHFKRDQAHFYWKSYAPSEGSSNVGRRVMGGIRGAEKEISLRGLY